MGIRSIPQNGAVFGAAGENNVPFNALLRNKGQNWCSKRRLEWRHTPTLLPLQVELFENQI